MKKLLALLAATAVMVGCSRQDDSGSMTGTESETDRMRSGTYENSGDISPPSSSYGDTNKITPQINGTTNDANVDVNAPTTGPSKPQPPSEGSNEAGRESGTPPNP